MSLRKWTIKLLPWVITAAILGYLAFTTDFAHAYATLKRTNFLGFVPAVIGVAVVVFLFDSGCLVFLFRRFVAPVGYREMLPLKGTSYFLNVINYNAAAASIGYFFRNRKGVPLLEAIGAMLWMNFIDIVSLTTLMLIGMMVSGHILAPGLRDALLVSAGAIYLILAGSCLYWNGGFDFFVLRRMRSWSIFTTFAKATFRDYAFFIGLRTLFAVTYIANHRVAMPFFDMEAPLRELVLYVPVLTIVGTIPLTTIAGLGTVQVLMQSFFYDYAPAGSRSEVLSHINAYSTVTILSFVIVRILIAFAYMRHVTRDIQRMSERKAAEAPESAAGGGCHSDDSTEAVR